MTMIYEMDKEYVVWYYTDVHNLLYGWIDAGTFVFDGEASQEEYTDLDRFILRLFGYTPSEGAIMWQRAAATFNEDVRQGKLDVSWLFGEHGWTLFKAKMARMACDE